MSEPTTLNELLWVVTTISYLIYFPLIGVAAGSLASKFMGWNTVGFVGSLVIGAIGAVLGGFVAVTWQRDNGGWRSAVAK
jgi:uncharacterized membrane protein YeaQ/YmgE (transglycosylase-associated protein family)